MLKISYKHEGSGTPAPMFHLCNIRYGDEELKMPFYVKMGNPVDEPAGIRQHWLSDCMFSGHMVSLDTNSSVTQSLVDQLVSSATVNGSFSLTTFESELSSVVDQVLSLAPSGAAQSAGSAGSPSASAANSGGSGAMTSAAAADTRQFWIKPRFGRDANPNRPTAVPNQSWRCYRCLEVAYLL